jgi:hypothetical protein
VVDAAKGTTATLPFTVDYRGTTPSGSRPLSAATALPGATATPDVPALDVSSSTTRTVNVAVPVPANAPSGDHAVTLELPLPGGIVRRAAGTLRIPADPPVVPPTVVQQPSQSAPALPTLNRLRGALRRLRLLSTVRASVLRNGLRFTQEFLVPGTVVWDLRTRPAGAGGAQRTRGRLLGRATARITRAGRRTARVRLSRQGRRLVRRARRSRVVLNTTFTDQQGRRALARKSLSIRAR